MLVIIASGDQCPGLREEDSLPKSTQLVASHRLRVNSKSDCFQNPLILCPPAIFWKDRRATDIDDGTHLFGIINRTI